MGQSPFNDKSVLLTMVAELQSGNDNNDTIAAMLVMKHGKTADDWNKSLKEYKHRIKKTCREMAEHVELTYFKKLKWTKQEREVMACLGNKLLETERVSSPRGKCTKSQEKPVSLPSTQKVEKVNLEVSSLASKAQLAAATAKKKTSCKQAAKSVPAVDTTTEATTSFPSVESGAMTMTASKPQAQFDAFLSYNWGKENVNHYIVKELKNVLVSQELEVWFDDEQVLYGDVNKKCFNGMKASACIVIVLSHDYIERVNIEEEQLRGCALEFGLWSTRPSKSEETVFVVSDSTVLRKGGGLDLVKYNGKFSVTAGNPRYYDISKENPNRESEMKNVARAIHKIIRGRKL